MAIHSYPFNDSYKLKDSTDPVSVSVLLGNGQGGSYLIFKNQKFIAANNHASLGDSDSCEGKNLQIIAVIQDKLAETNWTSVLVKITQDGETTDYPYSKELPNDLDIASYNITILMKK